MEHEQAQKKNRGKHYKICVADCFLQLTSSSYFEHMVIEINKLKEVFLEKWFIYKNLSQVFHRCHGLGYLNGSLHPIFPYFRQI
jgi:protein tyrosine phosphatase